MPTNYTIYIVNQSVKSQLFWAFLSEPTITNNPTVFANSSTNLQIPGLSPDLNSFTIPVQYVIGAGASNNAVGLNTVITSNATRNTDLQLLWDVSYATTPPNQGPTVHMQSSGQSPAGTIEMVTNGFDQQSNQANEWYESMSFGVKTGNGFMGVTWEPDPNKTYTITPTLTFYITVGNYSASSLAGIDAVSVGSAELNTATAFDFNKNCTVVYDSTGSWSHYKGLPTVGQLSAAKANIKELLVDDTEEPMKKYSGGNDAQNKSQEPKKGTAGQDAQNRRNKGLE